MTAVDLTAGGAAIPRTGRDQAPLSFEQERLWSVGPSTPAYNCAMRVDLDGEVDPTRLELALAKVVDRHAVLRSSFRDGPDGPVQRVHRQVRVPFTVRDLPAEEVEAAVAAEARGPFDLDTGPVMRVSMLRLARHRSVLVVVVHHLAIDGWFRVLLADLEAAYAGTPLAPAALTYIDYACWQREQFEAGAWDEPVREFAARLARAEPLHLFGDRAFPDRRASGEVPLRVPEPLTRQVRAFASSAGASPFMVLLTAVHAVLARYARQREVTVGVPIDSRERDELTALMGFFVNLCAIRIDVRAEASFRELLGAVRNECLEAYEHRATPFTKVIEAARALGTSWSPTVVLNLDGAGPTRLRLGAAAGRARGVDTGEAKFDLNLFLGDEGEAFAGSLVYRTGLFSPQAAERFGQHWINLLGEALARPDLPLRGLRLEPDAGGGPQSVRRYPTRCLPALFTAVAARQPDHLAVTCGSDRITYGALDAWTNRLAHDLRARGVRPRDVVGLSADRSIELIAGQLAILKAGGAYLPLDPTYPPQRLALMVEDAGVLVLLGQRHTDSRFGGAVEFVEITECAGRPETPLPDGPDVGDAAYVIYTSGSAGRPKGVVVTHANVSRLLTATRRWFDFGPRDVWTAFHSYAFDFSVWEVWGALAFGGRLVIVPYDTSRSPQEFLGLLEAEGVTVLNQTPSAFAQLSAAVVGQGCAPAALRLVVFGGEALDFAVLRDWYAHVPEDRTRLVNMYGITETTIHTTYRPIREEDTAAGLGSMIGEPIPDMTVHLLDEHGAPVPDGIPGEIYVGGAGLACGYLGDPRRTAERFLPSPFVREPGERLYRTGDLACRTRNGDLRYLGRQDQQVKVRGYRIELGEIAAALREHPAVADAVAAVRDDGHGARLVGYVVPSRDATAPSGEQLRAHLANLLPANAIPAGFVPLDVLPLTANGKLDRGALPAPRAEAGEANVAPTNEPERVLAAIFAELLDVPVVGTTSNLFDLGGDSIIAMQIAARARAAGLWFRPSDVMVEQTVARLAALAKTSAPGDSELQLPSGPGHDPAGLTPMQAWFLGQEMPRPGHWNQSRWLLARDPVQPAWLERALHAVVAHHEALRAYVAGDRLVVADRHHGDVSARVDLGTVPARHRSRALRRAVDQTHARIDVAAGPLIQALVVDGLAEGTYVVLVAHHLAVDAVSWIVLLEDLAIAYAQLSDGHEIVLPACATSSAQWGGRLAAYARTPGARRELDFWAVSLAQAPAALPVDVADGDKTEATAATVWRTLDKERTALLYKDLPRTSGATVDEVLLAAAAAALHGWSGLEHFRIDMERHGREQLVGDVDLTRTVGWLTAIFPLDLPSCGVDPATVLQLVASRLRAIPNRGAGYGALRYLADPSTRATLAAFAEPEVAFNHLGQERSAGNGQFELAACPEDLRADPPRDRAPGSPRTRLLSIEAAVVDGELRVGWTHDARILASTAERLANGHLAAVVDLVNRGVAGGISLRASDLSGSGLSGDTRGRIEAALGYHTGQEVDRQ